MKIKNPLAETDGIVQEKSISMTKITTFSSFFFPLKESGSATS